MKLIYDEVLDILVDSFADPQDEDDDCYMFNRSQMNKISKAIRKAKKQEKLLELYKELAMFLTTAVEDGEDTHAYTFANINNLKQQIKELENDRDYF